MDQDIVENYMLKRTYDVPTQLSQGIGDLQEMGFSYKAAVRGAQVLAIIQAHMPISLAYAFRKCLNNYLVDFEL
jgi:hypothetical protein